MLSDEALTIALRLRQHVGSDTKGIGPDVGQLMKLFSDVGAGELRDSLEELDRLGFVTLVKRIATPQDGIPDVFRDVAGVIVQEPMQEFLDSLDR